MCCCDTNTTGETNLGHCNFRFYQYRGAGKEIVQQDWTSQDVPHQISVETMQTRAEIVLREGEHSPS